MTKSKPAILLTTAFLLLSFIATCQYLEKIPFDSAESTNGYYLAIPQVSSSKYTNNSAGSDSTAAQAALWFVGSGGFLA